MSELNPHRQLEILIHSDKLTQEDIILAHTIRLAAEAAANQTIDGSAPAQYVPDSNPNQVLEFGRPIEDSSKPTSVKIVDGDKIRRMRRLYRRANLSSE